MAQKKPEGKERKRILIEFFGGDWDGRSLDTESQDPDERRFVHHCFFMTRQGTVARAFHGASLSQFRRVRACTHAFCVWQ